MSTKDVTLTQFTEHLNAELSELEVTYPIKDNLAQWTFLAASFAAFSESLKRKVEDSTR